ncbi:MAG: hypothetical protein RL204_536 [Bacteroidota bacterium]|jgi:hypothetical protein
MKPRPHLFFTILISFASLFGISQTDAQIKSRKIKVVVSYTTDLKDGIAVRKFERESFDKKGNLIERESFSSDSIRVSWKKFEYDKRGNLIKESTLNPTTGIEKSIKQIEYNKFNDEVLVVVKSEKGVIEEETETQYDSDRRRTLIVKRDGENRTLTSTAFKYDNKGMLVSRITVNGKGDVIVEKTISYTY